MDLAKVGEILQIAVEGRGFGHHNQIRVNQLLMEGWVLVSVKTIPTTEEGEKEHYSYLTVFVLGKPRKPKPQDSLSIQYAPREL